MEPKPHASKTNTVLLVAGLLLLLLGGFYYWSQFRQSGNEQAPAGMLADSSQADAKQLADQVDALRSQLAAAKEENASLTEQINGLNGLLSQTYDRLGTLEKTRMDRLYPALTVRNDGADEKLLRDSLSNQLALANGKADQLGEVTKQNQALQRLLNERDARLQTMVSTSAVTGDGFRVSLLKSNEKVTAKAKKVNALDLSFTIPAERRLEGTKDVYLSLVHESGRAPARPLPLATVTLPSGKRMIPVDAMQTVTFNGTDQPINFRFHPAAALKPGNYRASIYTNDAYLGSVNVQLRDSFWFF